MKEDKIYWTFSIHGREEKHMQRFHKEILRRPFKDLKINTRILNECL
jgi:hypothetical protein